MADYISREAAVIISDYAADEHPYDKDPKRPETFSEYNQGWNDACDFIRDRMEREKSANEVNEACRMGMEALERTRWIPCSERLPEKDGVYLAANAYIGWIAIYSFAKEKKISGLWGLQKDVWWRLNREWGIQRMDGITHWMPLPEPPEEGGTANGREA